MSGEAPRRKWSREERERILTAAFPRGAVVAKVARQFDVASSVIYTWRRHAVAPAPEKPMGFSPAILIEPAPASASLPPQPPPPAAADAAAVAIFAEFSAVHG